MRTDLLPLGAKVAVRGGVEGIEDEVAGQHGLGLLLLLVLWFKKCTRCVSRRQVLLFC